MSEIATARPAVNPEPLSTGFALPPGPVRRVYVRYPDELAVTTKLALRPSERFLLQQILLLADSEGKSWPSAQTLSETPCRSGPKPCYSIHTLRVGLRRLKRAGLLLWERIWPNEYFPEPGKVAPVGADGRRRYTGSWTWRGGRVWWPNLELLGKLAGKLAPRRPTLRRDKLAKLTEGEPKPKPSAAGRPQDSSRPQDGDDAVPMPSAVWQALGVSRAVDAPRAPSRSREILTELLAAFDTRTKLKPST